jgi:ADP-heptose:LPS heptosyltransferase
MSNWLFGFYRGLGDSICATPALTAAHRANPEVKIKILASHNSADIFLAAGFSESEIIRYHRPCLKDFKQTIKLAGKLKKLNFDRIFISPHSHQGGWKVPFFTSFIRGNSTDVVGDKTYRFNRLYDTFIDVNRSLHILPREFEFFLKAGIICKYDIKEEFHEWYLPQKSKNYAENVLNDKSDCKKVGIHIGAGGKFRRWGTKKFMTLIKRLIEECNVIIYALLGPEENIAGNEIYKETYLKDDIHLVNASLFDTMALMQKFDLFIGVDSGPAHLAAAFDVPSVVLFGPNLPELCQPWSDNVLIVMKDGYSCRPCKQKKCVAGNIPCMNNIEVNDVLRPAVSLLKK